MNEKAVINSFLGCLLISIEDLNTYDIDLNDNRHFHFTELERTLFGDFGKVKEMANQYLIEELSEKKEGMVRIELSKFFDRWIQRLIELNKQLQKNLFHYEEQKDHVYILNHNRIKVVLECYQQFKNYTFSKLDELIYLKNNPLQNEDIIKMKNGKPFPASAIARYFHLANIFIPSEAACKEYIAPYGLTSTDFFYNKHYTKLNCQSKRIAVNGESKRAYDAIIKIYEMVVELCEYSEDTTSREKAVKELEMTVERREVLF